MVEPLRHRQTKGADNRYVRPTATAPHLDSTKTGLLRLTPVCSPVYPQLRTSANATGMSQQWATSGLMSTAAKFRAYSMTSSARASSVAGTSRPSILAVSALITSSNFDACTTGKSAGFAPLRMRPAYAPTWRKASTVSLP